MGWGFMDFLSPEKRRKEPMVSFRPREEPKRDMVSGVVARCLYLATRDYAKGKGQPLYIMYELMGLGNSTSEKMRKSKPIAQATALKILKYIGSDVRQVLSKYQQEQ